MNDNARRWRRPRWSIASLAFGAFVLVSTEFLPVGVLPEIAEELEVSTGSAGLMILIPGLIAALSAPVIVVALARVRRDRLVQVLGVLLLAANLIGATAPTFEILLVGRVLVGIALGGFWAVVPSLGFRIAGETRGTRATSIILAGISAGTVIGLPAGQLVGATAGWRALFLCAAALSLLSLAAQIVLLPSMRATDSIGWRDLTGVFESPPARVGLIVTLLVVSGQFAASTFLTPFLANEAHLPTFGITAQFLVYGLCGVIGTLLGGLLIDRSRLGTMVGVSILMGIVIIALPISASLGILVFVLVGCWGLLWGIVPLSLQTWMMASRAKAPEAASAVLVFALQASIAVGSLLGGVLVDSSGLRVDYIVGGILALLSGVYPAMRRVAPK